MADVAVDLKSDDPQVLNQLGMKAFIFRDYNGAVSAFSKAIELIVSKYGETHDSLATIYLFYGKSLLEVSREEAEPLGDAVPREISSDSDDDAEDVNATAENSDNKKDEAAPDKMETVTEEVSASSSTNGDGGAPDVKNGDTTEDSKETKEAETSEPVEETETKTPTEATANNDEPSSSGITSSTTGEDTTTEEDPSDLQVAWEVLELAKLIFEKRSDVGKKELAETLVVLGEVSLESENFESAIADIKQGLEIQKTVLPSDSRTLAETYYKLAIALSTNNQIDEAVENFNTSLSILKTRISKLEEDRSKHAYEVGEIESLIPEIEEKIADMKTYKEEAATKLATAMAAKQEQALAASGSSDKPANDISHLVKRKRKLDEIVEGCEESPAKKQPQP